MIGTVGVLNVGAGDTKLTFDKSNLAETIRAGRIVRDMLRHGYALLIEVPDGNGGAHYARATDFDENTAEYIIADFDPIIAEEPRRAPSVVSVTEPQGNNDAEGSPGQKTESAAEAGPQGPPEPSFVEGVKPTAAKAAIVAVRRCARDASPPPLPLFPRKRESRVPLMSATPLITLPHSERLAAIRAERRELRRRACERLRKLQVGESVSFPLPTGEPAHRNAYLAINAAAYFILGRGAFRLRQQGNDVTVTRVLPLSSVCAP